MVRGSAEEALNGPLDGEAETLTQAARYERSESRKEYRRRDSSVEDALMEMYLTGVSVRRAPDITQVLRGCEVSPATISEVDKKLCARIEEWRNRPVNEAKYPCVYVDVIYLKRNWAAKTEMLLCVQRLPSAAGDNARF